MFQTNATSPFFLYGGITVLTAFEAADPLSSGGSRTTQPTMTRRPVRRHLVHCQAMPNAASGAERATGAAPRGADGTRRTGAPRHTHFKPPCAQTTAVRHASRQGQACTTAPQNHNTQNTGPPRPPAAPGGVPSALGTASGPTGPPARPRQGREKIRRAAGTRRGREAGRQQQAAGKARLTGTEQHAAPASHSTPRSSAGSKSTFKVRHSRTTQHATAGQRRGRQPDRSPPKKPNHPS